MRRRGIALLVAAAAIGHSRAGTAQRSGFVVVGDSTTGGWTTALEAVGYRPGSNASAAIFVVREGAAVPPRDWRTLITEGAFLVIEGASPLAAQFGFTQKSDSVTTRRERDVHDTSQVILWEKAQRVPRVSVAPSARVYSQDRWNGVPLLAGLRIGRGGVLWAATSPGESGFERMPYLNQALSDLGARPPLVGNSLQTFLDYSYRTRADPAYMAAQWRRMGIARLTVSSWYFFDPDPARDHYLQALIDAAHRNGITVYAWLELPHVSESFWVQHPEWREKNGLLQDALVDWRKNMNLLNPQSFAAASALVTQLLHKFDWDGVTLSELYFEGTRGLDVPADMTPFNDDVRREVRAKYGFDPGSLFDPASPDSYLKQPQHMKDFQDYRADLQRRLHQQWLDVLAGVRRDKGSFGITVCYVDDVSEPKMRELIGADVRSLVPIIESHDATLLVQDPFVLWGLGPDRYNRIAHDYGPVIPSDRLAVDINIVERKVATFPTKHQTGTELFRLVHTGQREFPGVSLYAENSILPADLSLLPSALATVDAYEVGAGGTVTVDSPRGVGVRWMGEARVDGAVWPYVSSGIVWLPSGRHTLAPSTVAPAVRLLDFTGGLEALSAMPGGLSLRYRSEARAIVTVARAPSGVLIDGARVDVPRLTGANGRTTLLLPSGSHTATILVAGPSRSGLRPK